VPLCRISVLPQEIKCQNYDCRYEQQVNQARGYKATIEANQPKQ